jgi:hypothetical protein
MFMYWRGGHTHAEWEATLVELQREVEQQPDPGAAIIRRGRPIR